MSWIRSDQALLRNPKTVLLKTLLGVEMDTLIGRLHMLWWWCLDYAIDGNLAKHHPKVIENACGIPLKLLISTKFVDKRPCLRIHDWWQNQGNYLKLRYRDQPEIWTKIKESYDQKVHMGKHMSAHMGIPKGKPVDVDLHTDVRSFHTNERTDENARETSALGATPRASSALAEEIEERERNKAWPQNTKENLKESGPEIAKPEEVKAIMEKWRKENPRSGSH